MPKISVIIPVYGVEQYIEKCARSLFEQTLDDIEYIFIDDCTPDSSIEILKRVLKEYPNRQSQVHIHKMNCNSGQAAVRKWGIENAKGQFVIHCDSDDWIDAEAYQYCYNEAINNNSDIVFFDFEVIEGNKSVKRHRNIPNNKQDILRYLVSGQLMGSLCGMLVKRTLYDKIIFYPKDNLCEDLVMSIQLINEANKFSYIRKHFYHYFQSSQSITSKGTFEKAQSNFLQSYNNTELIIRYLHNVGMDKEFKHEILNRKLMNLKTLYPYSNIKEVRKICDNSYDIHLFDVIRNKINVFNVKWFYILYILRIASYIYKLNAIVQKK